MLKSELTINQLVRFKCNGKGRGGHYNVLGNVTKIRRTTAELTEAPRSYSPGTRWIVVITELTADTRDMA